MYEATKYDCLRVCTDATFTEYVERVKRKCYALDVRTYESAETKEGNGPKGLFDEYKFRLYISKYSYNNILNLIRKELKIRHKKIDLSKI